MSIVRSSVLLLLLVFLPVTSPESAVAQDRGPDLRYRAGLAVRASSIFGVSEIVDGGLGVEGTGGLRLGHSPVWLRADGGFVALDATTPTPGGPSFDNTLVTLVAGPELEGRLGVVRPFVHALGGFVLNVPGGSGANVGTSGNVTAGGGAGVRIRLSGSPRPPLIEIGLRLSYVGELSYTRIDSPLETDVTALELRLAGLLGLP